MVASAGTEVFQLTTTGFQGGSAGPGRNPTRALYTDVASVDRVGVMSSSGPGFGRTTSHRLLAPELVVFGDRTLPFTTTIFGGAAATESLPCPRTSKVVRSAATRK